jgi:hypothetical protein
MHRRIAITLATLALLCSHATLARTYQLSCSGQSVQGPIRVEGTRSLQTYNAIGDGFVRFEGSVQTGQTAGRMQYEGYTRTGAFQGLISGNFQPIPIAVLDNTGGEMIIYAGGASLGAPEILARLRCAWR